MNYFCDVKVTARKDAEKRMFFVLDEPQNGELPKFTQRMLYENATYKGFVKENRAKIYPVRYWVYKTEETVTANIADEEFIKLIERSERCTSGEFEMTAKLEVHKKKNSKGKNAAITIGVILVIFAGTFGGLKIGEKIAVEKLTAPEPVFDEAAEDIIDGMKILQTNDEESAEAEQITILLDRSYSAVPKDDIQLKGNLIDGVAEITLPEFDREDFFSHVPGYTFGFSSIPDGDKIEYYGGKTYKFEADTKLYRVCVKYGGGSGTKEDPYIINYHDQLELMAEEKARGYFKQTCDIEFPDWATHTPIDTINELKSEPEKEIFEYNGGGYCIKGIDKPMFGKVSGASIHDVNISKASIKSSEYKYYGFIACEAYNYQYNVKSKNYETGETIIKNCSVSDSSIAIEYQADDVNANRVVVTAAEVEAPEKIEYDKEGNVVTTEPVKAAPETLKGDYAIGSITGVGGQIEDCAVRNVSVSCTTNDYFLFAGGIAGKPANVFNSFVSSFSASGHIFTSGGIVGSAGGARKYNALGEELPYYYGGNIQGCAVLDSTLKTEFSAGGLVGEGTSSAKDMLISNCYVYSTSINSGKRNENGLVTKAGFDGGIIGYDGQAANGHTVINCVSPSEYKYIGSATKSKGDDSVRLAPEFAYHQDTILNVLNANSINKNNPSEIFTGKFAIDNVLSNEGGNLAYPETVSKLLKSLKNNNQED